MNRVIAVVACGFTLAACSSSPSPSPAPPTQALRIESKPPGAEAKTSLGRSCRTPCELEVQAADGYSMTLTLKGYQPQTVSVRKDAADSSQLAPKSINVELQPVKKRIALKKKPAMAARAPSALPQPTQPSAPPTAAPVWPTPGVEAAAATNR
jgi:PEGA domain